MRCFFGMTLTGTIKYHLCSLSLTAEGIRRSEGPIPLAFQNNKLSSHIQYAFHAMGQSSLCSILCLYLKGSHRSLRKCIDWCTVRTYSLPPPLFFFTGLFTLLAMNGHFHSSNSWEARGLHTYQVVSTLSQNLSQISSPITNFEPGVVPGNTFRFGRW